MVLSETEYQNLRVYSRDLQKTPQVVGRQMRTVAETRQSDAQTGAGLVFAVAATAGTFNDRLEDLEEKLGV